MSAHTFNYIWEKLRGSKRYREEFVGDQLKRSVPFQARVILKARRMRQQDLADAAGLSQGVVSRALDVGYGNLTLNTIIRLAAGFDLAFIGRFVPFSELARWTADLPDEDWSVPTFEEEDRAYSVAASAERHAKVLSFTAPLAPIYSTDIAEAVFLGGEPRGSVVAKPQSKSESGSARHFQIATGAMKEQGTASLTPSAA